MLGAFTFFAIALASTSTADLAEWGGFRGNNGCGVAASAHLATSIDPDAPQWRVEIPKGYSSPVVAGEHIYLTAEDPNAKELYTLCLNRDTGEELWRKTEAFDGKRVGANSSAAPSPATDGEVVAALFHAVGLVVYNVYGDELWRADLGKINIPHGMSTSPVIHKDAIIVLVDQDGGSFLTVLDRDTGETRWRADRTGFTHTYSTPAIYEPKEGPTQIVASGAGEISGYDLATGERIWWVEGAAWQTKSIPLIHGDACIVNAYMVPSSEFGIPRINETWEEALAARDKDGDEKISRTEWDDIPMLQRAWFIFDLDGDDLLNQTDFEYLVSAGIQVGGLYSIGLDGQGDVTGTHVRWAFDGNRGLPDIPSPVLKDDVLYMLKDGGILTAVDAKTGEVLKQARIASADQYFASPVTAGDKLIAISLSGQVTLVQTGAEWEELSTADLTEETWSTPAIAGNQVFIRTQEAIYCFDGSPQG